MYTRLFGYFIRNSLRFRGSNSAYLRRTPGVAGNLRTWTASFWYKNGVLNTNETLFSNAVVSDSIGFRSSRTLEIYFGSGSANLLTSQSFRDTAAWYHIVVAVDTTQATSSNRIKLYVNGSQVTAFSTSTYPSQNYQTSFNRDGFEQEIGRRASNTDYPLDGYMAEVNWIDGQLFLGHDEPQYGIIQQWLNERFDKLWIHCKNIEAMEWFNMIDGFNYFWHEEDTVTLTSRGAIWAYPGKQPIKGSIAVMPEIYNDNLDNCIGICSDNVKKYK